jgi:Ulp1 family protease
MVEKHRRDIVRRQATFARRSKARRLLIPVQTSRHWILHVIRLDKRTIESYDSLSAMNEFDLCHSMKKLIETRLLLPYFPDDKGCPWKHVPLPSPQQPNWGDCGVYAMWNATYAVQARKPDRPPSQFRPVIRQTLTAHINNQGKWDGWDSM